MDPSPTTVTEVAIRALNTLTEHLQSAHLLQRTGNDPERAERLIFVLSRATSQLIPLALPQLRATSRPDLTEIISSPPVQKVDGRTKAGRAMKAQQEEVEAQGVAQKARDLPRNRRGQ